MRVRYLCVAIARESSSPQRCCTGNAARGNDPHVARQQAHASATARQTRSDRLVDSPRAPNTARPSLLRRKRRPDPQPRAPPTTGQNANCNNAARVLRLEIHSRSIRSFRSSMIRSPVTGLPTIAYRGMLPATDQMGRGRRSLGIGATLAAQAFTLFFVPDCAGGRENPSAVPP
jgi:hypothetical protein